MRGAATGNTEVEDVTEPGTDVMLEVGDALYYEDDVVHKARGAGDDQPVLWATGVFTPGEPLPPLTRHRGPRAPGISRSRSTAISTMNPERRP